MEIFKNLTEEQKQKAKEAGWCTDQGMWVHQKWSPANQALEQDMTRSPLQASAIMKLIEDLKAMTTLEIVLAFHSKRPLTPNMQGAMVFTTGRELSEVGGQPVLRKSGTADGTGVLAVGRLTDSQGGLQTVCSGGEAGRAHSVRTLILRNNANYCYANAAIRALLWAVAADPSMETLLTNIGRNFVR